MNENEQELDSKKLDSNGDEIVWELKHKKTLGFFWSWIARVGYFTIGAVFIVVGLEKYFSKENNGLLISVILLVLIILWFFTSPLLIYKTLNARKIFIKNNNLILQKYIGKDIDLPLGTFFIDIRNPTWVATLLVCDNVEIQLHNLCDCR